MTAAQEATMSETQPRRPRHLMDPNAPQRPAANHSREMAKLTRVQRWVASTLVVTTVLHLVVGFIIAAAYVPERSGKIGLCVIAGAFGAIAVGAALAIHRQRLLSPWLLLGVIPTLIGLWIVL